MEQALVKPGYKSSEFYVTIVTSLVGLAVTLGYIEPQQGDQLVQAIVAIIGGVLTVSSIALYLYGRFGLKKEASKRSTPTTTMPIKQALEHLAEAENIGYYPK